MQLHNSCSELNKCDWSLVARNSINAIRLLNFEVEIHFVLEAERQQRENLNRTKHTQEDSQRRPNVANHINAKNNAEIAWNTQITIKCKNRKKLPKFNCVVLVAFLLVENDFDLCNVFFFFVPTE